MINCRYAIYGRTSDQPTSSGTLQQLTGGLPDDLQFDPQIIWDSDTSRFYYAVLDATVPTDNLMLLGFSTTDSPDSAADWCKYALSFGNVFPDYPKLGDTADFWLIGTNNFDQSENVLGVEITWITKPPPGSACPDPATFDLGGTFDPLGPGGEFLWTPVPANQIDGSSAGWVVATKDPGYGASSSLFTIPVTRNPDGSANIPATASEVGVTSYSTPSNAQQPGTTKRLDTLEGRLTQAISAVDPSKGTTGLWTQHTVAGGAGSEVRWYEVDPAAGGLLRSGEASSPSLYTFNGAISPDRVVDDGTSAFGDSMTLGFNTSSTSEYLAIQFVTKRGDEAQSGFNMVKQSPGFNRDSSCDDPGPFCRWGDYSAATPDPAADPSRAHGQVWLTNMWNVASTDNEGIDWRTWNWAVALDPPPPSIQFASPTFSVEESAGNATVMVSRSQDTTGTVGVTYSTTDGSAVSGSDYASVSGTLEFAPGETSKTFPVPLVDDAEQELNETVNLTLSAPSGGAVLGTPSTATLTILANDGRRPDAMIKRGTDPLSKGDDVYNLTGDGQRRTAHARPGRRAVLFARLENDGNANDSFRLVGPGSSRRFGVRYVLLAPTGSIDITEEVVAGTFESELLEPDGDLAVKIVFRVSGTARPRSERSILVTATSAADEASEDAVIARVKVRG